MVQMLDDDRCLAVSSRKQNRLIGPFWFPPEIPALETEEI
jgi:hypothetical protein